MWAIQVKAPGEPAEVASMAIVPKPVAKPGELLIKMLAVPLNPSDFLFIRGMYLPPAEGYPGTAGAEGVGVVEAVGEGAATTIGIGAHVAFWHGYQYRGCWAEYCVLPETSVFTVPKTLPLGLAAQAVLNPLTMMGIIDEFGEMQPGEYVLQNGANSACGKFVIQYLKWKGFRTINVVRRSDQAPGLKALGADQVISLESEKLVARVDEITDTAKVKYAIDCVWGEKVNDMVGAVANRGKLIAYGLLDGPEAPIAIFPMILGMRSITGFAIPTWMAEKTKEQLQSMVDLSSALLSNGTVQLPYKSFSKDQWQEALKHAETPGKRAHGVILA